MSLRLTIYSSVNLLISDCNTTQQSNENHRKEADCKRAQGKILEENCIALTRDVQILKNKNDKLVDEIRKTKEERDILKFRLDELRGCVSSQRCPLGWRQINSKCYFLSTESKRWNDGRKQCQSQGADLVVIDNEQEQNAIYRMDGSQYLFFWIGLRRKDGAFKWVDGSELKTTFWQNGQPDNGGLNSKEDCVEMGDENQPLASWNDVPCEQMRRWLCEKDLCFSL
uniref:CD209 antigen-like protein E n=1 Tax=Kryptolebias marmoratus TaxID=37003 RepID=A0A3Q3BD85_KRYMA